ncbi:hypothetical protein ABPG74_016694 [Tetrahymena malaccensis]
MEVERTVIIKTKVPRKQKKNVLSSGSNTTITTSDTTSDEDQKQVKYNFVVNLNPRGYDLPNRVSFLLPDDIIINQYLYEKGSIMNLVDANCCPLMQFRPITQVQKSKDACIGLLDSSHPHQEDVDSPCEMLIKLQSSFAKRTHDALNQFISVIKQRQQLRKEISEYYRDFNHIQAQIYQAHLESQKLFEQMLHTASRDEYFYFHYKKFDLNSLSHKLLYVGHNPNLSELFGGDNDQNLTNLYMKKKGFPTYLDARGFLDFSLALFEKRDTFESTFVTFDGFNVPVKGKYTCYLLNQVEILPGKYYDGDIVEIMRFSINPNIIQYIKETRRVHCTIDNAIENFEYDMHSEIFIQRFYPDKFDELSKNSSSTCSSSSP